MSQPLYDQSEADRLLDEFLAMLPPFPTSIGVFSAEGGVAEVVLADLDRGLLVGYAPQILMQQDLANDPWHGLLPNVAHALSTILIYVLPIVVLASGLLMVSNIRYPHLINRYMKGRKSLARVITVVILVLLLVVAHRYILGIGCLMYALWGPISWGWSRARRRHGLPVAPQSKPSQA